MPNKQFASSFASISQDGIFAKETFPQAKTGGIQSHEGDPITYVWALRTYGRPCHSICVLLPNDLHYNSALLSRLAFPLS